VDSKVAVTLGIRLEVADEGQRQVHDQEEEQQQLQRLLPLQAQNADSKTSYRNHHRPGFPGRVSVLDSSVPVSQTTNISAPQSHKTTTALKKLAKMLTYLQ